MEFFSRFLERLVFICKFSYSFLRFIHDKRQKHEKHPSRISHKTHNGCNSYMIKEFLLSMRYNSLPTTFLTPTPYRVPSLQTGIGDNSFVPISCKVWGLIYSRSHTSLPMRKCSPPNSGLCVCATSLILLLTPLISGQHHLHIVSLHI